MSENLSFLVDASIIFKLNSTFLPDHSVNSMIIIIIYIIFKYKNTLFIQKELAFEGWEYLKEFVFWENSYRTKFLAFYIQIYFIIWTFPGLF